MALPIDLSPDPYVLVLTGAGLLIALVAWLPLALRRLPLSLPIVCIGLGAAIFSMPQVTLDPLPMLYPEITERFSEFVVIIALMGAGLKADAARELRPDLKVLFVTGYAENAVLSHGHLGPGMAVVTKPFDMAVLGRRIEAMISSPTCS